MLFKILFSLAFFFVFANANNLAKIYLNEGLEAVERVLEQELASKEFWSKELKDKNVSLGYYDNDTAIVLTNKGDKIIKVFYYNDGKIEKKFTQKDVLTGLSGDKEIEGDLKTPIGFYELGKKFYPGDPYYGPFAFATTYPNILDRTLGKTGGGIWIHGYPLDGTRLDTYKTRGCIAVHNDLLEEFYKVVADRRTYAMIEEKDKITTNIDEISTLLANLFTWKESWQNNDIKRYLSFYDQKVFKHNNKYKYEQFAKTKERVFSKNDKKIIKFSDLSISPYPNIKNEKIFRIGFYEDYDTKNYKFKGDKVIYVRLQDSKMQILAEQ
ncbi:L,D-transpeptidase family protein [Campylobacter insulaenigrae]|uniref:L,D-transpeptidase family protein n=7 Tax=Campylobacter insulaenigrae TaxID=260714 RepID=UPI000F7108AC|nr:polar amino acid transport system permease protein [Campylobacter insulaenigrae]VEJ54663.1 polar amino acid transport system permease protein [Campylobacter insulaenigrae]